LGHANDSPASSVVCILTKSLALKARSPKLREQKLLTLTKFLLNINRVSETTDEKMK
jgi:hypothetical protein